MFLPIHDVDNPVRHITVPWVTWLLIAVNVLVWLTVNALDDQGQLAAVAAIAHIGGPLPEWTSQVTGPLAEISLPGPVHRALKPWR